MSSSASTSLNTIDDTFPREVSKDKKLLFRLLKNRRIFLDDSSHHDGHPICRSKPNDPYSTYTEPEGVKDKIPNKKGVQYHHQQAWLAKYKVVNYDRMQKDALFNYRKEQLQSMLLTEYGNGMIPPLWFSQK